MKKIPRYLILVFLFILLISNINNSAANGINQQPTIAIPTVTGTPKGITATVNLNSPDPVNVRSGPGQLFELVGKLLQGQEVPVHGRSKGGEWLYIEYFGAPNNKGWIYAPLVDLSPGELQIIEPPPTPTPAVTETINPTLAAQFISTPVPTRLPTYTPVDPLTIPTYEDLSRTSVIGGIPMGLLILIIGGVGGVMAMLTVIKNR